MTASQPEYGVGHGPGPDPVPERRKWTRAGPSAQTRRRRRHGPQGPRALLAPSTESKRENTRGHNPAAHYFLHHRDATHHHENCHGHGRAHGIFGDASEFFGENHVPGENGRRAHEIDGDASEFAETSLVAGETDRGGDESQERIGGTAAELGDPAELGGGLGPGRAAGLLEGPGCLRATALGLARMSSWRASRDTVESTAESSVEDERLGRVKRHGRVCG